MQLVLQFIALFFLITGTLFSIVGMIGFLRLPDIYTRLHATGKISVFGVVFLLIAAMILMPLSIPKGLLLIFFILLAAPAVSHSIASAAYKAGVPMKDGKMDALKGKLKTGTDESE